MATMLPESYKHEGGCHDDFETMVAGYLLVSFSLNKDEELHALHRISWKNTVAKFPILKDKMK